MKGLVVNNPAISIIITAHNDEKTIKECIRSVLYQTYQGYAEIIVIDDASTDGTGEIVNKLVKRHQNILFLQHKIHQGLLSTHIEGAKCAHGDYIAILNGRDYVSIDYYRSLLVHAQKTKADIVIGDVVEDANGRYFIHTLANNDMHFDNLEGGESFNRYFEQEGLNNLWYDLGSKFSKRSVWLNALSVLKEQPVVVTKGEDVIISCLLMFYGKKIVKLNNVPYFRRNQPQILDARYTEIKNEIYDLIQVFNEIDRFLIGVNAHTTILEHANRWRQYYKTVYFNEVNCSRYKFRAAFKRDIADILNDLHEGQAFISGYEHFYKIQTQWNDKYENTKKKIADKHVKLVSFDIFDTAVIRPFMDTSNVFRLLDDEFRSLMHGTFSDFSVIRLEAEHEARRKLHATITKKDEITMDDIYKVISNDFGIDSGVVRKMKRLEVEKEIEVCRARSSVYELYELAVHINKDVVFISDMYLSKCSIKSILRKTGYRDYKGLYVSSDIGLTKNSGDMYKFVIQDLRTVPGDILHIGDDNLADFQNALSFGLQAIHYPSTKEAFAKCSPDLYKLIFSNSTNWQNNTRAMSSLSVQVFVSLMINKYFDNPYVTFNDRTDFNCDPSFVGYGAFGMFLFGLTSWIMNDASKKKYDVIGFMSRDGYMPMRVYKTMAVRYGSYLPKPNYIYTSRQALMATSIQNESDIFKLDELIRFNSKTPRQLIPLLSGIFEDISEEKLSQVLENDFSIDHVLNTRSDLWRLLRICRENFHNEKDSHNKEIIKRYLNDILPKKACVFDIGYSAKPEMYISKLIGKRVDAYFVHGDSDSDKHAKIGSIELNTFYDYTPSIYALLDEMFLSEQVGSCKGYMLVDGVISPFFEAYRFDYIRTSVMRYVQATAMQIIDDVLEIIDINTYVDNQKYYYSMLYNVVLQSIKDTDMELYSDIRFDDDALGNAGFMLTEYWTELKQRRNQQTIKDIFSKHE